MADDKNVDKDPKQNDWSSLQNSEQQHQNSTTTDNNTSQQTQNQTPAQSVNQESGNGGTKLEQLEGSGATDTANVSNNSSTERKLGIKGVKNEEKKIFVGGISWDTTEEDLKGFFGQFGEVSHVQIKYDHFTGRSRGFAFVEFLNPDSCQQALEHKDREIKGKKCEVKPAKSRENKKIFIGGLPADFSEDELRKHFEQFGKVLEEIEWPYDKFQNKRKNFAFVVFEDEDATQKAAQQQKQRFGDRMCDVKIAVPQYMRPQRQYGATGGWGTGWSDYGNYGGYSGYGGGYGGYYDDYYSNYDYTGGGSLDYSSNWQGGGGIRYDGWSYGGAAAAASVGGGNSGTTRGARSAYPTYGGY